MMAKEDKELLLKLKDICGRLPYGVYVEEDRVSLDGGPVLYTHMYHPYIESCRPYLRPMSSMTEEERKEFDEYTFEVISFFGQAIEAGQLTDWLNSHRFDYRGLIKMGLALEAPEGMYNYRIGKSIDIERP